MLHPSVVGTRRPAGRCGGTWPALIWAWLLTGLLTGLPAAAQALVPLTVSVFDESEAIVPGAVVSVTSSATGITRDVVVDAEGQARIDLPPGEYTVVARAGDLRSRDTSVTIDATPLKVKLRLRIEVNEDVTVTASRPEPLAPAANGNAVAFDESLFRDLPSDGQDILPIVSAFLAPAAVGAGGVSILVDGVETDELDTPNWALKDVVVNTNPFAATFQHPGSARIEVTTKQASRRRFRGTFVLSARNGSWTAQDPFALSKPDLSRRTIEGGLSGPLPFDHASFFVNGSRLTQQADSVVNAATVAGPLIQNVPASHDHTNVIGRIDSRPGRQNQLTMFGTVTDDLLTADGVGGFTLAEHGTAPSARERRVRVADQAVLSPQFTNLAQVSVGWQDRAVGALPISPTLVVNGAFTSGPAATFRHDSGTAVEVDDSLTYAHGSHLVQLGGRIRRNALDAFDASNQAGTFRFASLAAYEATRPFAFQISRGSGAASFTDTRGSAYVQDDWRLGSHARALVGLRYDWQSLLADRGDVAPRASLAFTPGTGSTVFRVGGGLFYDHLPDSALRRVLLFDGTTIQQLLVLNPPYPAGLDPAAPAAPSVVREAPVLHTPTTVDVMASVEQALGKTTSLTATFEALRGRNLFRSVDLNAPDPVTGLRPNPAFSTISQLESSGTQSNRALVLSFRTQIGQRFRATAQYRLSRTTNDVSGIFTLPADSLDLAAEAGRADFDRRHQLNAVANVSLPAAFRIGAVVALASGMPYDITTGSDVNHDGLSNARPPGVTRNTGEGPGLARVDLRVSRLFRLPVPGRRDTPPRNFDLSLDAFNVLNRVNYVTFVGVVSSPFFGRANAALPMRTLQLSMRYHF